MVSLKYWLVSICLVFIKPIPKTFKKITQDVKGVLGASIAWVVLMTSIFIITVGQLGFYEGGYIAQLIIAIIIMPIWFLLFVYLLEYINKRVFHRKQSWYEELLFSTTIVFILTTVLDLIPIVLNYENDMLNLALLIYPIALLIISVIAITKVKIWQSIVSVLLVSGLSVGAFLFIGFFLMSMIQVVPSMF